MLPATVLDIEWVDDAWHAEETDHATLHAYWRNACRTSSGGQSTVDEIDPSSFKGVLRHVMLLDVEESGYDARYRVYGSGIVDKAGRDWTGFTVAEMNRAVKAPQSLFYRACHLAVFNRKEPMFTHHLSAPWITSKAWKRLIVPVFGNDDAAVPGRKCSDTRAPDAQYRVDRRPPKDLRPIRRNHLIPPITDRTKRPAPGWVGAAPPLRDARTPRDRASA